MTPPFPWIHFLPTRFIISVATLGPLGRVKRAPGTLASFVGLIYYTLFFFEADPLVFTLLMFLSLYLAIAFCSEAEIRLRRHDPPEIVLDELIAVPLCFVGLEGVFVHYPVWMVMLLGFFVFRFYDIFKPFGISRLQKIKGGAGIVVDDLAAAVMTSLTLHLGFWIWTRL